MSWDLNNAPPTLNLGSAFTNNTSYNSNVLLAPSLNCFLRGTKILTRDNGYVAIEQLRDGDVLKTTMGETILKKKLYRCVSGVQENLPYKIPQNHFAINEPSEDTYLSPLHCIWAKGDWMCMYQTDFKQDESKLGNDLHYYHLLTTDYSRDFVYCNGIVSESLKPTQENYELYKECIDEAVCEKL